MKVIELWSDSFHEGDWACQHLSDLHQRKGLETSHFYENGFIPVYDFKFPAGLLRIKVYGSYGSWSPIPIPIKNLITWGKPDFLAFDPVKQNILFAVEETAAVPTGNQALQRCERLYGASRAKIPFWYLLAEYGKHKDGGIRRDSIWPSIMAIKLSLHNSTPSVVLHYSDLENPEEYDSGKGVEALFQALHRMLLNFIDSNDSLTGMDKILSDHYSDMFRFLRSQYTNFFNYLPGIEHFNDENLLSDIIDVSMSQKKIEETNLKNRYVDFLHWPDSKKWIAAGGDKIASSKLIKYDKLAYEIENSIDVGESYVLSLRTGSKPQQKEKVKEWLDKQIKSFDTVAKKHNIKASLNIKINDFPKTAQGNLHLTTAKNVFYLFDKFSDLKNIIYKTFPRTINAIDEYNSNQKTMIYLSNSIKPGRIFGDPFTGQISAYATIFGKFDSEPRLIVAYFPHQSFSQFIDTEKKLISNKGFILMREMLDFAVLGGGIIIKFKEDGRAEAL